MEVEIQPTARELLAIIAILWMENDSYRSSLGSNAGIHFTQRVFSNADLVRGWQYGPKARVTTSGAIIVNLDS